MNDRDRAYNRPGCPELYGRGELLDKLFDEFQRGRRIFGLDGVGGVGKSEIANRFGLCTAAATDHQVVTVNVSEWPSEALLVAAIYRELRAIPSSNPSLIAEEGNTFRDRVAGIARRIALAAVQDAIKCASDKLENVAEAVRTELTGETASTGVAALLETADAESKRLFIREYMHFLDRLGHRVTLVLDNCEDAEPSAQSLIDFLITAKPDGWAIVLVVNAEKISDQQWNQKLATAIDYNRGIVIDVPSPDDAALGEWFEDVIGRAADPGEVRQLRESTNGGRPVLVGEYLQALKSGSQALPPPDLSRLYTLRRSEQSQEARKIAELLALAGPDRTVPLRLLAAAAGYDGVESFGAAVDGLLSAGEVRIAADQIAFKHSSFQGNWRGAMDDKALQRCRAAWYKVFVDLGGAVELAGTGLVPQLAGDIAADGGSDRLSFVARQLLEVGVQNEALALLEAPVGTGSREMNETSAVIANSLLAAQTRLDIGRYRDAQESLRLVELHKPRGVQAMEADLLRLKLALRQNAYSVLWTISDRLRAAEVGDSEADLERELVLNAALRDMNDLEGIERSVGTLNQLMERVPRSLRGKAERSLARSYAKLGRHSEALAAANESLEIAESDEDLRSIGNARLALAEALRYGGETSKALESYRLGAELGRGTGNRDSEIWCLLGMACAFVEGNDRESATRTAESLERILFDPGFDHPLETAHLELIRAILCLLAGETCDVSRLLSAYEALGVRWPRDYLAAVSERKALPSSIPL